MQLKRNLFPAHDSHTRIIQNIDLFILITVLAESLVQCIICQRSTETEIYLHYTVLKRTSLLLYKSLENGGFIGGGTTQTLPGSSEFSALHSALFHPQLLSASSSQQEAEH